LFDLTTIIFAGLIGLLVLGDRDNEYSQSLFLSLSAVFLIMVVGMYFARQLFKLAISGWLFATHLGPWKTWPLLGVIGEKLQEIPAQLDRVRKPAIFFETLGLTIGIYGAFFAFNLILLRAVGADHGLGLLLVLITIVTAAAWLPISISGFGVIEGGWAIGLVLFTDLNPAEATAVGFFMHGSQVIATAFTGLIGSVLLLKARGISARLLTADQPNQVNADAEVGTR